MSWEYQRNEKPVLFLFCFLSTKAENQKEKTVTEKKVERKRSLPKRGESMEEGRGD